MVAPAGPRHPVVFLRKRDVFDAVRRLPVVGYAVGKLAVCLPGLQPRRATARSGGVGGSNPSGSLSDRRDDSSEAARWIMGQASATSSLGRSPSLASTSG